MTGSTGDGLEITFRRGDPGPTVDAVEELVYADHCLSPRGPSYSWLHDLRSGERIELDSAR